MRVTEENYHEVVFNFHIAVTPMYNVFSKQWSNGQDRWLAKYFMWESNKIVSEWGFTPVDSVDKLLRRLDEMGIMPGEEIKF